MVNQVQDTTTLLRRSTLPYGALPKLQPKITSTYFSNFLLYGLMGNVHLIDSPDLQLR